MRLSPNPKPFHYDLGSRGENLAAAYLKNQGYHILEKNFRCALGEIDLIAEKRQRIVFVEVKTRTSRAFGSPEASVTPAKQKKLIRLAEWYLKTKPSLQNRACFDVIAVMMNPGLAPQIRHIPNAFGPEDPVR